MAPSARWTQPAVMALEMFHDGDCPLCMREVRMLQRLDRRGAITFTDIAAPGFVAPPGRSLAELNRTMHARQDGEWVEGVEVFRQLYAAVGLGPLVAFTRLPGLSGALDWGYAKFAKNRLRLTGRCDSGVCELPDGSARV